MAPPEALERVVVEGAKVLGITVRDPLGLNPVSFELTIIFGGGPAWNAIFFDDLS